MPDLDILDKSQDDALAEVMEKIMFPNDEHLADCYHCIGVAKKHVGDDLFWSELFDPITGALRARYIRLIMGKLLNCPSLYEMKKIQEKSFAESFVVGLVIMNMYKMHLLGEEASLGKAAYATRAVIEKLQIKLPISDIEKKFRARRSSAHLAAAMILSSPPPRRRSIHYRRRPQPGQPGDRLLVGGPLNDAGGHGGVGVDIAPENGVGGHVHFGGQPFGEGQG